MKNFARPGFDSCQTNSVSSLSVTGSLQSPLSRSGSHGASRMISPVGCLYLMAGFGTVGLLATGVPGFPGVPIITPPGPLFDPEEFLAVAGMTPGAAARETITSTVAAVGEEMIGTPTIFRSLPKLIEV